MTQQLHQGGSRQRVGLDISDQGLCILQALDHHVACVSKSCICSSNADDRAGERTQLVSEVRHPPGLTFVVDLQKNERYPDEWRKRFAPAG
jgi:nitrate reductase beta subunit